MSRRGAAIRRAAAACAGLAAVALSVGAGAGCADDESAPAPAQPSGFERALERVGEGVTGSGTGFGWADVAAVVPRGRGEVLEAARALGPGIEDLFAERRRLRASLGLDPLAAESAIGVGASYAFGVRLDGVSPGGLARALRAAGARSGRVGGWRTFDLGEQATASTSGPLRTLDSFGARVAVAPRAVVLARTDAARAALLGRGPSPLADPGLAFAADCLGEVEAARTLPGTFTHNSVASPRLIAIGSRPAPAREEVLCAVGGSEGGADSSSQAEALRRTFDPAAREPLTGEPMRRLVSAARVDELSAGDLSAARAVLELGPAAPRGVLFGALVRGSLLAYAGGPEPLQDG